MIFKLNFKKILFSLILLWLFLPATSHALDPNEFKYTPMEEIPGFGKPTTYSEYVLAIYKFGLWTVGISAVLMISVGAFMYITSAGNASSAGKAKGIITDAIAGVILAMVSYVLLYTINPALIGVSGVDKIMDDAAKSYDGTYPVIESPLPASCSSAEWKAVFTSVASSSGLDACLLEAVTAIESSCKQQPSRTNGGQDCGAMQTRAASAPCNTTCDELEKSPTKAIECGAAYLKSNYRDNNNRGSNTEQKIRDYYAGFNGGPGALAISSSCTGMTNALGFTYEKWDCPKDCGGYCVVPPRTSTVFNYYNKCKAANP